MLLSFHVLELTVFLCLFLLCYFKSYLSITRNRQSLKRMRLFPKICCMFVRKYDKMLSLDSLI